MISKKIKYPLIWGGTIWAIPIIIGIVLSISSSNYLENFTGLIIGLVAFAPVSLWDKINTIYGLLLISLLLIIYFSIALYSVVKKKPFWALIFLLITVISFVVGIIRYIHMYLFR